MKMNKEKITKMAKTFGIVCVLVTSKDIEEMPSGTIMNLSIVLNRLGLTAILDPEINDIREKFDNMVPSFCILHEADYIKLDNSILDRIIVIKYSDINFDISKNDI